MNSALFARDPNVSHYLESRRCNVLICIEMLLYVKIVYVGWFYIKPGGRGLLHMCPVVLGLLFAPCDDSIYTFTLFWSV